MAANAEALLDPLVLPQVSPHQAFPKLSVVRSKKVEQFVNDDIISNLLLHAQAFCIDVEVVADEIC